MNSPLRSALCVSVLTFTLFLPTSSEADGVRVGSSSLIGTLDYSDTFTGSAAGGRPDRPYQAALQPPAAYVIENSYGNPPVFFQGAGQAAGIGGFSFAGDSDPANQGFVQGTPAYPLGLAPNASRAGSDFGFTQTGGGIDYGINYNGLRLEYVVQVDAIQVGDRIDVSSGTAPGIFNPQSLSVFFRGDGSGNASLYNGSVDTPIRATFPEFNTGITGPGQWYNYAVRYDIPDQQVELFVNQTSLITIDLLTFAGGIYSNFSNAYVGAGSGLAGGEDRTWTDNFQVGQPVPEPGTAVLTLGALALAGLRRRRC